MLLERAYILHDGLGRHLYHQSSLSDLFIFLRITQPLNAAPQVGPCAQLHQAHRQAGPLEDVQRQVCTRTGACTPARAAAITCTQGVTGRCQCELGPGARTSAPRSSVPHITACPHTQERCSCLPLLITSPACNHQCITEHPHPPHLPDGPGQRLLTASRCSAACCPASAAWCCLRDSTSGQRRAARSSPTTCTCMGAGP